MKCRPAGTQGGNALLVILVVLTAAASHFLLAALARGRNDRERTTTVAALAQAREALIGFAATYRDTHSDEVFGFLPCPDADNDGIAEASCGAQDVSAIGRLPWKTLGLPPLRDSAGECLWYATSGRAKDGPPKTAVMNWDTVGQLLVRDAAGTVLAGAAAHDRPLAVVLAPGPGIGGQNRAAAGRHECGGNDSTAAYLDGSDAIYSGTPVAGALSILTLATAASEEEGSNNDHGISIAAREIFARVKRRGDFKTDIDTLVGDAASLLAGLAPAGSKGAGGFASLCPSAPRSGRDNIRCHWQDNLLYTRPAAAGKVNGAACDGILIFAGERTDGQTRSDSGERSLAANYLEGGNAALFPNAGDYRGASEFLADDPAADIVRCVAAGGQYSFASHFASFVAAGNGVVADSATQTLDFTGNSSSTTGGCFWFPAAISLAGKTLRAYYDFGFSEADSKAIGGGGTDRGNGFTFQLVRGDLEPPQSICGKAADMGALAIGAPPGDIWASRSIIVETDVRRDTGDADPSANHTAIMANGNLYHTASNGQVTTACNGSAMGCAPAPANRFEESPLPQAHNQRLEIHTGCNAGCGSCNPAAHAAPTTYIRIRVWIDCGACADLSGNFPGSPAMQRCIDIANPDTALNNVYFGFSGGFRTGSALQGVNIRNFSLRSE